MNKLLVKADRVFSLWIRQKATKHGDNAKCVTCGKVNTWKQTDAGHYMKRGNMSTRFDEKNVHVQCTVCNRFHDGKPKEMKAYINRTYGDGTAERLEIISKQAAKIDLQEIIDHYSKKLKEHKYELR